MLLKKKIICSLVVVLAALGASSSARAGVLTFDNFVNNNSSIDYTVTIDDLVADLFTVKVKIDSSSLNVGDILGVGFDIGYSVASNDIDGNDITEFGFDTRDNGNGNNFNGVISDTFDVLLTIGNQGSSGGLIQSTTFTVDQLGNSLDATTFTRFGIRIQSVGLAPNGGNGSNKDISTTSTFTPTPDPEPGPNPSVPEPASVAIFGALGLLSLASRRRRNTRKQA